VIRVYEFEEFPIICIKDTNKTLKKGAIYTRTKGKVQSAPVSSEAEMREIIEMAIHKRMSSILSLLKGTDAFGPTDEEKYQKELDFEYPLIYKIHSKGYWCVIIRPINYVVHRISLVESKELVESSQVRRRGWPYPAIQREGILSGNEWVYSGRESDWFRHIEYWRLYRSGQFVHEIVLREDIEEGLLKKCKRGLEVVMTNYQVTEILEFSSRLATSRPDLFKDGMEIIIELHDMQNRKLFFCDARYLSMDYVCDNPTIVVHRRLQLSEILSDPYHIALEMIKEILIQFNWNHVSMDLLRQEQKKLEG